MVWWVDNKTAPLVKPRKSPVFSSEMRYFTDEIGKEPTVPQAEWFNMIQGEIVQMALSLGVMPDKLDDGQIGTALEKALAKITSDISELPKIIDALGDSKIDGASQRIVNVVNKLAQDAHTALAKKLDISKVKTVLNASTTDVPAMKVISDLRNEFLAKEAEVPVDQIFTFESENGIVPTGYIVRKGVDIDPIVMPKLFARYGSKIPDDRDRVHRMTGTLAGNVGETQEDAVGKHEHSLYVSGDTSSSAGVISGGSSSNTNWRDGKTKMVGGASETRVKSRTVIFCNKIQ